MKTLSLGASATCAAAVLTIAFSPAASAASASDPGSAAASFLAGQLGAGNGRIQISYEGASYDDLGLTIDTILALDAAKTAQTAAAASSNYVVANAASYISYSGDHYAGPTGKLLVLAAAQGLNPRSVGGTDLVSRLQSLQTASGRFKDKVSKPEYESSNMVGQALDVIGLKRAGASVTQAAAYIATQQCADGGFTVDLDPATCSSDADATGIALQALMAAGGHDGSVAKGLNYLKSHQNAAGAIASAAGVANTNTTGLAGSVFAAAGDTAAAAKASSYVKSLQYDCTFPKALIGGIAFNKEAYAARKAGGAKATVDGTDVRATPQALLAIAGIDYATVSAGGSAATPAVSCATATGTPTASAPATSPSTTSSSTSSTTKVTGPPVITDGPAADSTNAGAVAAGGAVAALAIVGFAGAALRTRRRR